LHWLTTGAQARSNIMAAGGGNPDRRTDDAPSALMIGYTPTFFRHRARGRIRFPSWFSSERPTGDPNKGPTAMKQGIHPEYREVVFQDMQTDFKFITRSTVQTRDSIEMDGKTYPLVKLDTSSESHPFYTGAQTRIVETGRVEKFRQKFAAKTEQVNAAAAAATKAKEQEAARARKK
jgi:large subunit ribosomal protein L31